MKWISHIIIAIVFFISGLLFWHNSEWMRGYCWGYIEGQLEHDRNRIDFSQLETIGEGFVK